MEPDAKAGVRWRLVAAGAPKHSAAFGALRKSLSSSAYVGDPKHSAAIPIWILGDAREPRERRKRPPQEPTQQPTQDGTSTSTGEGGATDEFPKIPNTKGDGRTYSFTPGVDGKPILVTHMPLPKAIKDLSFGSPR